jgi:uncharacterized protein (TIGR03083 family)
VNSLTDRVIDAHRRSYEQLAGLVASLSDEQLTHQSGAADWPVSQVLSHLGSGNEIHLDTLKLAQAGHERPTDQNEGIWARWNAMSPREQADGFLHHGKALADWVAELDATQREDLRVVLPYLPEPAPLALYLGLRLNEDALHGWDVAVAYDDKTEIPTDTAEVLLELHRGPLAFMLGFTGKPAELGTPAHLAVRTPEAAVGLQLAERAAITDVPANPDGELRLPLGAFLRLMAGRHRDLPDDAVSGSVTAEQLRKVFPGY